MGNQISGEQLTVAFYRPTSSFSAGIALNGTGLTNVVNVTEEGILSAIGILVATGPGGSITAALEIQVDGQTTESIAIYTAGITFQPAIRGWNTMGDGAGAPGGGNSVLMIPVGLAYQTSLRVGINVTVAGSSGSLDVNVMRGKRI